jgi:hypothetical protein
MLCRAWTVVLSSSVCEHRENRLTRTFGSVLHVSNGRNGGTDLLAWCQSTAELITAYAEYVFLVIQSVKTVNQ